MWRKKEKLKKRQQELGIQKRWQDRHLLREKNLRREKGMTPRKRSQRHRCRSLLIRRTNKFRRAPILSPNGAADSIFRGMQIQIGWKPNDNCSRRLGRASSFG